MLFEQFSTNLVFFFPAEPFFLLSRRDTTKGEENLWKMWWGRLINCDASKPYKSDGTKSGKKSPRHSQHSPDSSVKFFGCKCNDQHHIHKQRRLCNAHVKLHSCKCFPLGFSPPCLQHELQSHIAHAVETNGKNTPAVNRKHLNVKVDWVRSRRSFEILLVRNENDFPDIFPWAYAMGISNISRRIVDMHGQMKMLSCPETRILENWHFNGQCNDKI